MVYNGGWLNDPHLGGSGEPMHKDGDTDDDTALFRRELAEVQPLKQDRVDPHRRKPRPIPLQLDLPADDELRELYSDQEIETGEVLLFSRPGLQKRVVQDLRRGRMEVGLELDLHGLTVAYARQLLQELLRECRHRDVRCVQIIHGKGKSSEDQPVLKHKLNLWLRQREEVLAFCSARPRDGGTGAVYVLLRHPRPQARGRR
jgi:DNA-nicking Smr family endonuclease